MGRRVSDVLSRDEIRWLTTTSDVHGAQAVAGTWALILGSLGVAATWPSIITALLAIVVVGGRQLALAVLLHEASHRTLFRTRWLNELAGSWLCGAPVWVALDDYRAHHLAHHRHTGTDEDPDLALVAPYPASGWAIARRLLRDLVGISGVRRGVGLLLMDMGLLHYTVAGDPSRNTSWSPRAGLGRALPRFGRLAAAQGALLGVLVVAGWGWTYALWVAAWLTTFGLFLRVRSVAEHACTDDSADVWRNTRTTSAGPVSRLLIAPHHVNYHLEHHLLMTVPSHKLPVLHTWLSERDALEGCHVADGYRDVFGAVARR